MLSISAYITLLACTAVMPETRRQSLLIGHRGCGTNSSAHTHGYCENTVNSFMHAHRMGADAVEFDVHVTSDGVPVVFHNSCIACNGTLRCIHAMSYDEFVCAAREYVLRERPGLDVSDCRNVPGRLEDLFACLDSSLIFNVEIKYPSSDEVGQCGTACLLPRSSVVESVLYVLMRYDRRVLVSSFDIDILVLIEKGRFARFLLRDFVCTGCLSDLIPAFGGELRTCILSGIEGIVFHTDTLGHGLVQLFQFIRSLGLVIMLYGERLGHAEFVEEMYRLDMVDGFIVDDVSGVVKCLGRGH